MHPHRHEAHDAYQPACKKEGSALDLVWRLFAHMFALLQQRNKAAAGPADAEGGAAATAGICMEVEAAAVPWPLSPMLAAMACSGAEPGLAGSVAAVPTYDARAGSGGGGGLQPERLLREAEYLLRDILGEGGELEALPPVTVQQVHLQQGGQLAA